MSQGVQVSMLLMGSGVPQLTGRTMARLRLCFWLGDQLHFLCWEFLGPADTWRSSRNECIFICVACLGFWNMCLFLGHSVQHRHKVMHRGCSLLWLQLFHGTTGSRGHSPYQWHLCGPPAPTPAQNVVPLSRTCWPGPSLPGVKGSRQSCRSHSPWGRQMGSHCIHPNIQMSGEGRDVLITGKHPASVLDSALPTATLMAR